MAGFDREAFAVGRARRRAAAPSFAAPGLTAAERDRAIAELDARLVGVLAEGFAAGGLVAVDDDSGRP